MFDKKEVSSAKYVAVASSRVVSSFLDKGMLGIDHRIALPSLKRMQLGDQVYLFVSNEGIRALGTVQLAYDESLELSLPRGEGLVAGISIDWTIVVAPKQVISKGILRSVFGIPDIFMPPILQLDEELHSSFEKVGTLLREMVEGTSLGQEVIEVEVQREVSSLVFKGAKEMGDTVRFPGVIRRGTSVPSPAQGDRGSKTLKHDIQAKVTLSKVEFETLCRDTAPAFKLRGKASLAWGPEGDLLVMFSSDTSIELERCLPIPVGLEGMEELQELMLPRAAFPRLRTHTRVGALSRGIDGIDDGEASEFDAGDDAYCYIGEGFGNQFGPR